MRDKERPILQDVVDRLNELASGYWTGHFSERRYGVTVERLAGGRQIKLYAEELGGADHISFNLYLPRSGRILLKPCEMSEDKVIGFVLAVVPEHADRHKVIK